MGFLEENRPTRLVIAKYAVNAVLNLSMHIATQSVKQSERPEVKRFRKQLDALQFALPLEFCNLELNSLQLEFTHPCKPHLAEVWGIRFVYTDYSDIPVLNFYPLLDIYTKKLSKGREIDINFIRLEDKRQAEDTIIHYMLPDFHNPEDYFYYLRTRKVLPDSKQISLDAYDLVCTDYGDIFSWKGVAGQLRHYRYKHRWDD